MHILGHRKPGMQDLYTGLLSGTHSSQRMTDPSKNMVTNNEGGEAEGAVKHWHRGGHKPKVEGMGRRNTGRHAEDDSPHHCRTVESEARRKARSPMDDIGIWAGDSVV